MKRNLFFLMAFLLLVFSAYAQMTGSVSGTVTDSSGNPLENARVVLGGGGMGGHGHGMGEYFAWTDDLGEFSIDDVDVGEYEARAMLSGYGYDEEDIEVANNQNTVVNFVLGHSGGHQGGHCGHEWEEVTLQGWTIVEEDSMMSHYFLDEDNNGEADYRLGFGPPDYEPPSGAQRPEHGDEITIVGGLMNNMMNLPMVMVWELNGLTWMEPDSMGHHGGHGGGWHGGHGCSFEDPSLIAANGWAMVDGMMHDQYWLDENSNQNPEFRISFGVPDYRPHSGAQRPLDGDWVEIVGGLIEGCPDAPTIVVYELNGRYWRTPGDTTGLGGVTLSLEDQPNPSTLPLNHVVVEAYPNPFNPTTELRFTVPSTGLVKVVAYDVLGREVAVLQNNTLNEGLHTITFDGSNLTSGIYFILVEANGDNAFTKVTLLK